MPRSAKIILDDVMDKPESDLNFRIMSFAFGLRDIFLPRKKILDSTSETAEFRTQFPATPPSSHNRLANIHRNHLESTHMAQRHATRQKNDQILPKFHRVSPDHPAGDDRTHSTHSTHNHRDHSDRASFLCYLSQWGQCRPRDHGKRTHAPAG